MSSIVKKLEKEMSAGIQVCREGSADEYWELN